MFHAKDDGIIYLTEDFFTRDIKLKRAVESLYDVFTHNLYSPSWCHRMPPNSSYSQAAYAHAANNNSIPMYIARNDDNRVNGEYMERPNINLIPNQLDSLFAFALPESYKLNAVTWVKSNDHTLLTQPAASCFRKYAKFIFWRILSNHYDAWYEIYGSITETISSFMTQYGISLDELETVKRSYSRERVSTKKALQRLATDCSEIRSSQDC